MTPPRVADSPYSGLRAHGRAPRGMKFGLAREDEFVSQQPLDRRTKSRNAWVQGAIIATGWLVILSTPGCVSPMVMTGRDYEHYNSMSLAYGHGKYDQIDERLRAFKPRSVADPERKQKWDLTLEEAKRLALANNKQIVALESQPGQAGTVIDLQLSQFDAFFATGGAWTRQNIPLAQNVATAGTGQNAVLVKGFGQSQNTFLGADQTGYGVNATTGGAAQPQLQSIPGQNVFELLKRNATGGTSRINYLVNYTNQTPIGVFNVFNPVWQQRAEVSVQQPFLQGAGIEFNRAPVLIARSNYEQSIRVFQQAVQQLLRDVEASYWQLDYAYYDLYSREVGLEEGLATWQRERAGLEVGQKAAADVAQAREQVEFFRAERVRAMQRVLDAERNLRNAIGLPPEDDRQIVPADEPSRAQYMPDWPTAVGEAASLRPDVVAQTFAVRSAELEVLRQQNGLYPDLTGTAEAALSGLDNQFDQSVDRLTDMDYESWLLGLRYRRQIGERSAHARVRAAQMTLSRERDRGRETQHRAYHELADAYRNLVANYELIRVQGDRRRAANEQLNARLNYYRIGKTTIDDLLEAQTAYADGIRDEALAVAQYNQSLAQWEFARGTIFRNDNVQVSEDIQNRVPTKLIDDRQEWWRRSLPLPIWAGVKVHANQFPCPDTTSPLYPAPLEESLTPIEEDVPSQESSGQSP